MLKQTPISDNSITVTVVKKKKKQRNLTKGSLDLAKQLTTD